MPTHEGPEPFPQAPRLIRDLVKLAGERTRPHVPKNVAWDQVGLLEPVHIAFAIIKPFDGGIDFRGDLCRPYAGDRHGNASGSLFPRGGQELNFTRASERCNVTQPSLSRAIKLLEEELGGLLFHRERESTHITDLGHMVRPHLQLVYDHSRLVKRLSREFVRKWPLKLGIMSTISPDEIVDLIANIRTRHPEVELRLCDANAKELRARLLDGDLEVAIYALPGGEPDEHIHSIPLFREQMVLAVRRDHRLANAEEYPVQEMNGECYIHRVNCEFAGYADQILQQKGVACNPVYWSERDDWTLAMVAAGLGFAFMPANSVKHPGVIGLPIV
jgi:LysR family hydrogen peroxide-inducible transcriptional activator